jgi:hypothetical protein
LTKKKSLKEGGSLPFGCYGLGLEIAPPSKWITYGFIHHKMCGLR